MALAMVGGRRVARSRRWRGFSLFGVLLGLAVAGVVIVGAVALYNQTQESAGRSEILTLLSQLKGSVERVYAGRPSYGTAGTDLILTIDRRGGIPDNARIPSATAGAAPTIQHPFNGNVSIRAGVGEYEISFGGLDNEICAALADVYVDQSRARTGLVGINFASGTTPSTSGTAVSTAAVVTIANVTSGCNNGASNNVITFRFG